MEIIYTRKCMISTYAFVHMMTLADMGTNVLYFCFSNIYSYPEKLLQQASSYLELAWHALSHIGRVFMAYSGIYHTLNAGRRVS